MNVGEVSLCNCRQGSRVSVTVSGDQGTKTSGMDQELGMVRSTRTHRAAECPRRECQLRERLHVLSLRKGSNSLIGPAMSLWVCRNCCLFGMLLTQWIACHDPDENKKSGHYTDALAFKYITLKKSTNTFKLYITRVTPKEKMTVA